jgi:hypothetical protein
LLTGNKIRKKKWERVSITAALPPDKRMTGNPLQSLIPILLKSAAGHSEITNCYN